MIKDIMAANESVAPNQKEMAILRENFPSCFRADGTFDMVRFSEFLKDKIDVSHEGYELKFLGKNYEKCWHLLIQKQLSFQMKHITACLKMQTARMFISVETILMGLNTY